MLRILIADDDVELCQLLTKYLSHEGFAVEHVHNGNDALSQLANQHFDLLILDIMMPEKNGFETLQEIRQQPSLPTSLPVIMLTAKGEKIDRIVGLEMGADDYLAKPCDPRELVARIRAVTRRTSLMPANQPPQLSYSETPLLSINGVCLDKLNRQVTLNNVSLDLTSSEFDLLALLMENAGKLVSKQKMSEKCLGKKLQLFDRSIDMHLSNLRKKLTDISSTKPRIKTIRGSGYQYLIWPEDS